MTTQLAGELLNAELTIRTFIFDGVNGNKARKALDKLMDALQPRVTELPPTPFVEYVASRGESKIQYWVTREEGDRILKSFTSAALSGGDNNE